MAQRVAAIFPSRVDAQRAADALVDLGADRAQISIVARGEDRDITTTTPVTMDRNADRVVTTPPAADVGVDASVYGTTPGRPAKEFVEPARRVGDAGAPMTTADPDDAAEGAAEGAAIGAAVGIALGAAALMVPGVGPVLAAGPLAWALGGAVGTAVAGAIAGGIYGSLRDIGIEDRYARGYEERIRSGDVLLTAILPTNVAEDRILDVLSEYGAEDISFADDTSIARSAVSSPQPEAQILSPDYQTTNVRDRDYAMQAQPEYRTPTTTPAAAGAPDTNIEAPATAGPTGATAAGMAPSTTPSGSAFGPTSTPASTGVVPGTRTAGASGVNEESSLADRAAPPGATDASPTTSSFEATTVRVVQEPTPPMSATGAPASQTVPPSERDMETGASYAESLVGATATDGAELNVDRGEQKQVEGEMRDRAADRMGRPMEKMAAKGEKVEGKLQEKSGEVEETIEPRRV